MDSLREICGQLITISALSELNHVFLGVIGDLLFLEDRGTGGTAIMAFYYPRCHELMQTQTSSFTDIGIFV